MADKIVIVQGEFVSAVSALPKMKRAPRGSFGNRIPTDTLLYSIEGQLTVFTPARKWEARVAEGLSDQVFGEVFPALVQAIAKWVAKRERFLHWQVAFPGVWDNWESVEPLGGFDAVISNMCHCTRVRWFKHMTIVLLTSLLTPQT